MIKSFKHKGLKKYFETGKTSGIQARHERKLRMQLAAIDTAQLVEDIALPGFNLHLLKGNRKNIWSVTVNGNWRVTFEFVDGNAYILLLLSLRIVNQRWLIIKTIIRES